MSENLKRISIKEDLYIRLVRATLLQYRMSQKRGNQEEVKSDRVTVRFFINRLRHERHG